MSGFALTAVIGLIGGCKEQDKSSLEGFVASNDAKWAKNYIAAFLGDSDGIPGTLQDIGNIRRVFNPANGFNFEMPGPEDGGWKHVSSSQLIRETAAIARKMLDSDMQAWKNLQPGGTLFFYMTSHGLEDGSTSTQGGSYQFSEVAAAIRDARGGHPLERLVVMFDTCFAGSNIVGDRAISQNTGNGGGGPLGGIFSLADGAQPGSAAPGAAAGGSPSSQSTANMIDAVADAATKVRGLYKSGIFIGSSLPTETSGDNPGLGGTGTLAFLESVNAARRGLGPGPNSTGALSDLLSGFLGQSGGASGSGGGTMSPASATTSPVATETSTAKISDVLDGMVTRAQGQTPVWCVEPPELKDDFFFDGPAGYLPTFIPNAGGALQRFCRNGRN